MKRISPASFILVVGLAAVILSACGAPSKSTVMLPEFVRRAAQDVQEAYLYALEHPDEVAKYPCTCGCVGLNHTNNLDCYIQKSTGQFDNHASVCQVCVDITLTVKRLKAEGWTSRQIRDHIDKEFAKYGPPTDTAYPTE